MDWTNIKYFSYQEFDDASVAGSGRNMQQPFIEKLEQLRIKLGFSLKINSGFRSAEHNAAVGGVPDSAHTKGWAADIACPGGGTRFSIVKAALELGFTRIGIDEKFVHLDCDPSLVQRVVWLYPKKEN